MNIFQYCHTILFSPGLDSKLLSPSLVDSYDLCPRIAIDEVPELPERDHGISFTDEKNKFPSSKSLVDIKSRARALHFFANHELLAIEMMACAILLFPIEGEQGVRFRKRLLATIADEQKHFNLYVGRMQEWGVRFGDFSLNDYFWRQMRKVKSIEQFYAVVALTFEGANLDFALYYHNIFKDLGDKKTATILKTVLEDEISHVRMGQKWLTDQYPEVDLWQVYVELLPDKLSPARAKGIIFNEAARLKAGLNEEFIDSLKQYRDEFPVVNRSNK